MGEDKRSAQPGGESRGGEDIGLPFRSARGRKAAILGAVLAVDIVPLLVIADEYWLDLPSLLPGAPLLLSTGLVPLLLTLAGLAGIYLLARALFGAGRGEALVGLVSFVMVSLVILTLVGVFFRGPNMSLVLPF